MAGSGARDIKRKIKSVNSTRQITKAMELVSTAKLKTNRRRFDSTKPFFDKTFETIQGIFKREKSLNHPLASIREVKSSLLIVSTADRGLCGGYNVNVLRESENLMSQLKDVKIMTIGKKARDYFNNRGYNVVESFEGISEKPKKEDANLISDKAIEMFINGDIDEIYMVSTSMQSTISQVPKHIKLLPIGVNSDENNTDEKNKEVKENRSVMNYSPSPEIVLDMIIPMYVRSYVLGALIESSCAEQAARRNAMENASDNAKEMIDSLSLTYNQARQSAITQEITEIVSGASALG